MSAIKKILIIYWCQCIDYRLRRNVLYDFVCNDKVLSGAGRTKGFCISWGKLSAFLKTRTDVYDRHLKNLSMVLWKPRHLAFLEGGEEGESRLKVIQKKVTTTTLQENMDYWERQHAATVKHSHLLLLPLLAFIGRRPLLAFNKKQMNS